MTKALPASRGKALFVAFTLSFALASAASPPEVRTAAPGFASSVAEQRGWGSMAWGAPPSESLELVRADVPDVTVYAPVGDDVQDVDGFAFVAIEYTFLSDRFYSVRLVPRDRETLERLAAHFTEAYGLPAVTPVSGGPPRHLAWNRNHVRLGVYVGGDGAGYVELASYDVLLEQRRIVEERKLSAP